MIKDIQAVQNDIETNLLAIQPIVEKTALARAKSDPNLMTRYLTDYCVAQGERTVLRWRQLAEDLIAKYNDGYIRDANGKPQEKGYPEDWLRKVLQLQPNKFRSKYLKFK